MKIIAFILSTFHYLILGSLLLIFHPLQWICIHFISKKAHKNLVDFLTFLLVKASSFSFNPIKFSFEEKPPKNVPLIFVANHQSIYDIPPLIWFLREYSVRFVGKKELGFGIPSITINLRHNGSVLIDRRKPQLAVPELITFGKSLYENNDAGLIFPEGTRSRDGKPKPFKISGLAAIMEQIPNGYIVPITINNCWKITKNGLFPLTIGNKISFFVHRAIKIDPNNIQTQIKEAEKIITSTII